MANYFSSDFKWDKRACGKLDPLWVKIEERVSLYPCSLKKKKRRIRGNYSIVEKLQAHTPLSTELRCLVCEEEMLSDHVEGVASLQINCYHYGFIFSQLCQTSLGSDMCKVDGRIKVGRRQPIENKLVVEKLQNLDTPSSPGFVELKRHKL